MLETLTHCAELGRNPIISSRFSGFSNVFGFFKLKKATKTGILRFNCKNHKN
jgi:hypothetical protein